MNFKLPMTGRQENRISIPDVRFTNSKLEIGGEEFKAHPKSLQARVLEYFFSNPHGLLRRAELLGLLYENEIDDALHTIRFQGSKWCSGHKVMSRLRKGLAEKFSHAVPVGTEWLPFSNILDGWVLFKLPGYGSDGNGHS